MTSINKIEDENYQVIYDQMSYTFNFKGSLRLSGMDEYGTIIELMDTIVCQEPDYLTLNLKNLEFLNSSGISMLSKLVINIRNKKTIKLKIIGSTTIPWQGKSLKNLQRLMPSLTLELL